MVLVFNKFKIYKYNRKKTRGLDLSVRFLPIFDTKKWIHNLKYKTPYVMI
jgi:hypothetical protein